MFLFDWRTYLLHPREIFTLSTLQAAGVYQGGLLLAIVVAFFYMRTTDCPAFDCRRFRAWYRDWTCDRPARLLGGGMLLGVRVSQTVGDYVYQPRRP